MASFSPWRGSMVVAAIALGYFVALDCGTPLFQADDFLHLRAEAQSVHGSTWWHWQAWLGRVPIWATIQWVFFAAPQALRASLIFVLLLCHLAALFLLALALAPHLLKTHRDDVATPLLVWASSLFVLGLSGADAEILLWPTCMPYTVGALLMALGLRLQRRWARLGAMVAATLTYESFLLPGLWLLRLREGQDRKGLGRWLMTCCGVCVGVGFFRLLAAARFGAFAHLLSPSYRTVGKRLPEAVRYVLALDTPLGLVIILGLTACLVALKQTRTSIRPALTFLPVLLATTAPYWMLAYPARRAVYGSRICFLAWAVVIVHAVWRLCPARRALVATALTGLVFFAGAQTLRERHRRQYHRAVVTAFENETRRALALCSKESCTIAYGPLDRDLRRSWVLPPFCWKAFLETIALTEAPDKHVTFVFNPAATHIGVEQSQRL